MSTVGNGRYRPLEEIGSGGMAVVYRALDRQTGTEVALKRLLPQFARDRAVRRRFLLEAEAMKALDHPHAVKLLDVGDGEDAGEGVNEGADGGGPFMVTELLAGGDLRTRIDREGRLGAVDVRRIGTEVALALAHAHERGIVHRDVKPQNILFDAQGVAKLGDFGAARVQSLAGLTGSSLVWGSPEYMAPEVFARGRVDGRSDLFSLGVVLCEMATGRPPWGEAPLARLAGGPAPGLPPIGLGAEIDGLVASMLADRPGDRPASAADVAAALVAGGGYLAPVAPQPVACLACGTQRPGDVPRCFTCGRQELAIDHHPGARWRLVLAKLKDDAGETERLHAILEEITGTTAAPLTFLAGDARLYSKRERKEGIALPAILFSDLEEEDARRLEAVFRENGLAVMVAGWPALRRSRKHIVLGVSMVGVGAVIEATAVAVSVDMGGLPMLGAMVMAGASAMVLGAITFLRGIRLRPSRPPPVSARFRLRPRGVAVPAAERLLGQAQDAAARLQAPEARALLAELSVEVFRLARRAEQWRRTGSSGGTEAALAQRMLAAAPLLGERLAAMAGRLDDLDAALEQASEGEAVQAMARLERRLALATDPEERQALEDARRDAERALEERHRIEGRRAALATALCALLARLRDAYRDATSLTTIEEQEAAALEDATAELERALGSHDGKPVRLAASPEGGY